MARGCRGCQSRREGFAMNKSKLAVTIRLLPVVEERIAKEYQALRLRFIGCEDLLALAMESDAMLVAQNPLAAF
jgi:hypothetical protein